MAAQQGVDLYIDIRDFTRGIASSRHALAAAQPAPEDQEAAAVYAQERDTWGCYGHPAGGLHPLPGLVLQVEDPGDDWPDDPLPGATAPVAGWAAHPEYTSEKSLVVNASLVVQTNPKLEDGEVGWSTTTWRKNVRQTPDQLHILYGGYGRVDGASAYEWFQGSWEWRVFDLGRFPIETTPLMGGHLADDDLRDSLGQRRAPVNVRLYQLGFDDDTIWGDHFMSLGMSSANLVVTTSGLYQTWEFSDPAWNKDDEDAEGAITEIGRTAVVALCTRVGIWPPIIEKNFATGAYPDLLIETQIVDEWDPVGPRPGTPIRYGIVHQGRIVMGLRKSGGAQQVMGPRAYFPYGDVIGYYAANDLFNEPTTDTYRFMPENPGTIGVMASMNANEMIAIKHQGGGGLLRGDVSKPQFIALPGLPSIQGATNIPVVTTAGLVFGTRDGVYLWQGAEGAESISMQLDGWFWQPEGTPGLEDGFLYEEYPQRGKFNVSGHFVYAPNNWVHDMRTGGWFRLNRTTHELTEGETTTTYKTGYRNYEVSSTGRVYGIKPLVKESDLIVAHLYDRDVPAHQFSWRSQPIPRTINRRVDVREVVVTAQGVGTVTATVVGVNGQTDTCTFTITDADQPHVFTGIVNVISEDVEVILTSTGAGDATTTDDGVRYAIEGSPAPSIYRVSLGVRNGPSLTRSTPSTRVAAS